MTAPQHPQERCRDCCEHLISDLVSALTQRSFIDTDGDYHAPGLSHDEIWDIIEKHRSRSHSSAGTVVPKQIRARCPHCYETSTVDPNSIEQIREQARWELLDELVAWAQREYEASGLIDTMDLRRKVESFRGTSHSSAIPVTESKKYCIEITQRAYEVLKLMVEGNNPEVFPFNSESLSEWIMEEWGGYCDAYGESDVEIG